MTSRLRLLASSTLLALAASIRKLHDAFVDALKQPELRKRFEELATNPAGTTPEALARPLDDERKAARKLVSETRMSVD